jgi:hypothetical protein
MTETSQDLVQTPCIIPYQRAPVGTLIVPEDLIAAAEWVGFITNDLHARVGVRIFRRLIRLDRLVGHTKISLLGHVELDLSGRLV